MSLETAQFLHQLNVANPSGADKLKEGDDHIRLLKSVLLNTFPGLKGPLDPAVTHTFLNALSGQLVASGIISLWHGAADAVPAGWALCDGSKVTTADGKSITTPDLRGRVPLGVSTDYELLKTFGSKSTTITTEVGGAHSHTGSSSAAGGHDHGGKTGATSLSVEQMPAHKHGSGVADNNNAVFVRETQPASPATRANIDDTSGAGTVEALTSTEGGGKGHDHTITAAEAHKHDITIQQADGHSHKATVELLQPSIALHFIIKV